jgi:hypothetical protein
MKSRYITPIRFVFVSLAVSLFSPSGYAQAQPCDENDRTLLYQDSKCTIPLNPRFGEDPEAGDLYTVWSCNVVTKVTITEEKRKTRIAQDAKDVLESIKKGDAKAMLDKTCAKEWSQKLNFKRGKLVVKGYGISPVDSKETELVKRDVITGPAEHWFLGLDLPVTDQKTLKYDSESKTLKPRDKDPQLYLSVNYLIGDVLVDADERGKHYSLIDDVSIKFFVRASSHPLDSAGVGLGYRFPEFFKILKGVSVYGGYFWSKEDEIKDGSPQENTGRTSKFRFGVTFDVQTMIGAVKW